MALSQIIRIATPVKPRPEPKTEIHKAVQFSDGHIEVDVTFTSDYLDTNLGRCNYTLIQGDPAPLALLLINRIDEACKAGRLKITAAQEG